MNFKADRIKLAIGLVLSVLPCLQISSSTSYFSALYKSFELPVSDSTHFLMSIYPAFYALPLLVFAAWFMPKWRARRGAAALSTGIIVFLLGVLYGVALWWPIMSAPSASL
jgi:hypothetical protein